MGRKGQEPQYLWGKPNENWEGPSKASAESMDPSVSRDASRDFSGTGSDSTPVEVYRLPQQSDEEFALCITQALEKESENEYSGGVTVGAENFPLGETITIDLPQEATLTVKNIGSANADITGDGEIKITGGNKMMTITSTPDSKANVVVNDQVGMRSGRTTSLVSVSGEGMSVYAKGVSNVRASYCNVVKAYDDSRTYVMSCGDVDVCDSALTRIESCDENSIVTVRGSSRAVFVDSPCQALVSDNSEAFALGNSKIGEVEGNAKVHLYDNSSLVMASEGAMVTGTIPSDYLYEYAGDSVQHHYEERSVGNPYYNQDIPQLWG